MNEFENAPFIKYCDEQDIKLKFSTHKTLQQNGVTERKNCVLQDMATVMLHSKSLTKNLWAKVVNTACYIINKVYIRAVKIKQLTSYGTTKSPMLYTFRTLEANVIFLETMKAWVNLTRKVTMAFSWDIPQIALLMVSYS